MSSTDVGDGRVRFEFRETCVKTIGIVGGTAWPSSVVYCRTIKGRWDLVGDLLAEQGNILKAGADFFLLACNTVHTPRPSAFSAAVTP